MAYTGNYPTFNIVDKKKMVADYWDSSDPLATVNPPRMYMMFLNTTSGEIFSCTDNTEDSNIWVGDLGTVVSVL